MTGCLGCCVSTFRYYHFDNFTFSHSHENVSKRSNASTSPTRSSKSVKKPKKLHRTRSASHSTTGMNSHVSPVVPLTTRVSETDTAGAFNRRQSNMPTIPQPHSQRRAVQVEPDDPPPAYFDFRSNSDASSIINNNNNNNNNNTDTPPLSPPPAIAYRTSTNNSSKSDAARALAFTNSHPLAPNRTLTIMERQALSMGYTSLVKPPEMGRNKIYCSNPSAWGMRGLTTKKGCSDACLVSSSPLFSANHSPAHDFTMLAYFEVRIHDLDPKREGIESGIAIGFVAQPYPTWRMPGHERGSLGVHSDDGRRYINDSWGGRDFVEPFRVGELVGIGMKFRPSATDPRARLPAYASNGHGHGNGGNGGGFCGSGGGGGPVVDATPPHDFDVHVFCTKNGVVVGNWDLHEQVDAEFEQPGGLVGLEGHHDLYAAIGVFGKVDLEVRFGRKDWLFRVPPDL